MAPLLRPFSGSPPGVRPAQRLVAGTVAAISATVVSLVAGAGVWQAVDFDIGSVGGRKLAALAIVILGLLWFVIAGLLYRRFVGPEPRLEKD
jgi:hypothetical protein